MQRAAVSNALGLAGGAAGFLVGWGVYYWLLGFDYHALVLPGALLGLGCNTLAQHRSVPRGIACGVLALVGSLLVEWHHRPFAADESLSFFLRQAFQKPPLALMLVVGTLFAAWWGAGAHEWAGRQKAPASPSKSV